jgi:hypothetical protein
MGYRIVIRNGCTARERVAIVNLQMTPIGAWYRKCEV